MEVFYIYKLKDGHADQCVPVFNQSFRVEWEGQVEMTESGVTFLWKRPKWVMTYVELLGIPLEGL